MRLFILVRSFVSLFCTVSFDSPSLEDYSVLQSGPYNAQDSNGLLMRRFTDGPSASGTGLRFLTCNWIQLRAPCLKGRPRNNPGIRRDKDRTRLHMYGPKSAITFSITQSVKSPFLHRFAVPSVSFGDRVVFLRIARWALWSIELLCIISLESTFIRSADAFIRRDL